ncbi:MAG: MBL fold metallo-hydrolase [Chloroflexi bacterium]|nr:MBL fold metallo-hydrolase [Chloroflexota bacterium]
MEIVPGIHQLHVPIPDNPLGYLNAYLVRGKQAWTMIDTGWFTPDAFSALVKGLKDIGLSLTDVGNIIITHVHPDHFGLAGRIKQLSPRTELLIHRWEAELIESRYIKFSELQDQVAPMLARHGVPPLDVSSLRSASMSALQYVTMTLPNHFLYGGEIISTGVFDLEIIWTPGHSPGHICLYEPQNRLLFSGDHILPTITPNISYHVQSGDNPLGDYLNALNKLRHLPATKVLPAHEHIFTDLRGRIDEIIGHHAEREAEIDRAFAGQTQNAYEISSQISWRVGQSWNELPPLQKRFAVMETVAHLERMRWEGKVERVVREDRVFYRRASEN